MSVKFIVAPPGSGKTLLIVQREITHALKIGWSVYHNVRGLHSVKLAWYCGLYPEDVENQLEYMYQPYIEQFVVDNGLQEECAKIGYEKIEEKYNEHLVPIFRDSVPYILKTAASLPKKHLIVVDEAQNFIPATAFKDETNIKFFEYATVHRQKGHNIVLATQHEDNVDVKIRRVANLLIYLKRPEGLGKFLGNSVKETWYLGCSTGAPKELNSFRTKYDKRVFGLYKSYVEGDIVEDRKQRSVFFNGALIFLLVVFVLCMSRVPGFLRKWGVIGKEEKPVAENLEFKTARDYLGEYSDYYCGNKLYVLRLDGRVEILEPNGVPVVVCPFRNYSPGKEVAQ